MTLHWRNGSRLTVRLFDCDVVVIDGFVEDFPLLVTASNGILRDSNPRICKHFNFRYREAAALGSISPVPSLAVDEGVDTGELSDCVSEGVNVVDATVI